MTSPTPDPELARLIERVQQARSERQTLDIRGCGSKAFYGNRPTGEPLDVTPLRGISSYEPSELVVTVRAGTPLAELEAALAEQGQCLPFEPPRLALPTAPATRGGTVGGMVAAGLAGPARAAVGGVRDYVLGATMLNGRAELLSFGGQVMKNVAGYDVSRLLAGSLGILGVLCEVSLKVLPRPVASTTLRFETDQAAAIEQLQRLGGQPLPLNASAWWEGMLVLRLSGAAAAVESAARQLGGELIAPALASAFWDGLRDQTDEYFVGAAEAVSRGAHLWRLSVPAGTPPIKLQGEQLIEWGGAQRWLCSALQPAQVRETTAALGGHATLYRGGNFATPAFAPLSAPLERIHRELKAAFDPDGLFNPGRLYAGL
ncbi:MAG: glycolate oxidase subunit GlcE [Rubrivivax sp.]|nr:glycolate oxidase subunit GlcE [Rubrivivax sp.]